MNKAAILENLTQCRVDLRAAIIELDRVRPEKRPKKDTPRECAESGAFNGKPKAVTG